MRPYPRIRKTIKWACVAATLLLMTMWLGSRWCYLSHMTRGGDMIALDRGTLVINYATAEYRRSSHARTTLAGLSSPEINWLPEWATWKWGWEIKIPLWIIILASPPLFAAARPPLTYLARLREERARRRAGVHVCSKCRYDRAGLAPGALCPECGAAALSAPVNP